MCGAMLCASPIVSFRSVWPRAWPGAFGFFKNFTFLQTNLHQIIFGAVSALQQLSGNVVVSQMASGGSIPPACFAPAASASALRKSPRF